MEGSQRERHPSDSSRASSENYNVQLSEPSRSSSPQKASSTHSTPSRKANKNNSGISFSTSLPELNPSSHSLLSTLDPVDFTLDLTADNSAVKKPFTKNNFRSKGSIESTKDPDDPLSQLDPLWSLKKETGDTRNQQDQ